MFHHRALLIVAVLFLFSGCSTYQNITGYFNTYYNTKKLFDEAVTEAELLPQKSRDTLYFVVYTTSPATKVKFDRVIEKSSKLIQFYEKSSWLDDAIYMIGVSYIYKDENESAIRKFKELEENFPTGSLYRKAKLWHAKAEYFMKKDEEAFKVTKDLFEEARSEGDNDILLELLMLEAQMYFERQEYAQAAAKYALAVEVPGDNKLRMVAQYQLGFTYERMQKYNEAAQAYGAVKKYSPDFNYAVKSRLKYAHMLTAAKEYDRSIQEMDDLLEEKLTTEQSSLADLEIAGTDWAKGDSASAFVLYAYIDSVYKGTDASAKANYQRGLLSEKEFADFKMALKYYTKARDQFPQSEINPLAVKKVNSLTNYFSYLDNIRKYDTLYITALHEDSLFVAALHSDSSSVSHLASPRTTIDSTSAVATHGITKDSLTADVMIPPIAPSQGGPPSAQLPPGQIAPPGGGPPSSHLPPGQLAPPQGGPQSVQQLPGPADSLGQSLRPSPDIDEDDDRPAGQRGSGRETMKTRITPTAVKPGQSFGAWDSPIGKKGVGDSSRLAAKPKPIAARPLSPDSVHSLCARYRFELAGLFYLELELPDSGLIWYRNVVDNYPSSPFVPRSLYAMSEIYRIKEDSSRVDSLYAQILLSYEKSEYADQVRKILNMDALHAVSDPAALAYLEAEQLVLAESNDEAIMKLTEIPVKYPKSSYAPKAIYTIGWLYENRLMNNDTAAVWYGKIMKEYPTSVYAEKVQPKLAVKADPKALSQFIKVKEIQSVQKPAAPRTARTLNQPQGKTPPQQSMGNDRNANRDEEDIEDNTEEEEETPVEETDDDN